ncbi:hypothetical protein OIDMADRAFT_53049 [Oidiodendron maius Zn]|uniref:Rhodopsin domain-containing protein n=1 Tax=Oidiodendron maius (strain Zn) TaxID=913774 RepID=A0A0C3DML6_OIDMZ|nr:hypothetical protein OIDMADRAFT_53049 [Oidiodendron maius Zn]
MDLPVDLSAIPALPAPEGWTTDFNSPVNRAVQYIAVSSIVVPMAFVCVLLKLYMKITVIRKPGWDDLASIIAVIGLVAYQAIFIWLLDRGAGRHAWDVSISLYLKEITLSKTLAIIQQPTSLAAKLALLGMYHRLFSPKKGIKYTIIIGMVVCTIIYIVIMALYIPLQDNAAGILRLNRINKAQAILNLSTDIFIFVVPLVAISGLNLSRSQKIGVGAVFMTGSLAVASCVISVVYRFQTMTNMTDLTWQLVPFYIVLTVEISIGVMCGCMPVFPALLQKSGVAKWWSATYKSISSILLRSKTGTTMSSTKPSANHGYRVGSSGSDEDYVQLRDAGSIQKHVQIDVSSVRENSLTETREYLREV